MKTGKVIKFGDNINTDIISPPQYMELGIAESSKYAMSALDPNFAEKVKEKKILVAGKNFGSGSSRETSPLSLKYLGVEVIVAEFFARIFYRNAINVGLLVVECGETDRIHEDDELQVDYQAGQINNLTTGETYSCSRIPEHLTPMIEAGGLVNYLKSEMQR
ncbi:MAG: 3-isopropylmalate dehydratase [Brotaphodocola sp.]